VFGAGGSTSSYREVAEADVVLLWGSNARETHPIYFHHVLRAIDRGARLYVIDPRQTPSTAWGARHLAPRVGTDIELANAIAHVLIEEGLIDEAFIRRATTGFEALREAVAPWTPEAAEAATSVPAALIREVARDYGRADRAMICWTLGITEHRSAVDNVLSLINLALLTGHVGKWGSGVNPLRGQNNVQGGGDAGALPHKLPGFQDVEDDAIRARFEAAWGAKIPPKKGLHLTDQLRAMERGDLRALYCLGENPAESEADAHHVRDLLRGLDHLIVQDLFLTKTAELAHVVLPAAASLGESEGTVTNSERRVQRLRRAISPPAGARDDLWITAELSKRLGRDLGPPIAERLWDEMRALSPMHRGMSYARLEALGGIQWPCRDEDHPGTPFLHARLWQDPIEGPRAPMHAIAPQGPAEPLDDDYPLRLTTGRRLDDYNTGVQTLAFASPMRRDETLDLSPADVARYGLRDGERVRVRSRRGAVEAPVRTDPRLPAGLAFMTFHRPDQVDTNLLTIEATDPRAGTAEFKAAAVRIERLGGRPGHEPQAKGA
jgi:formate dehydrogenase major subunit